MAKILLYTFRTFPFINELKCIDPEIIIFGKLRVDLERLVKRVEEEKPDFVLGIAIGKKTLVETRAVNLFHKKAIRKSGVESFSLATPSFLKEVFPLSENFTSSFCNWTIYQISDFLNNHKVESKLSFIHVSEKDFKKLTDLLVS